MDRLALMSSNWQSDHQNWEMKCLPWSEMMSLGVPCLAKTCDKKIHARSCASISQKVGMNSAILVRWHTTTNIVSCPSEMGSPSIKSIDGVPWVLTNWKKAMGAKGLVVEGLAAMTDRTQVDVIGDEGDHPGPVESMMDVLDCLGDAGVASQAVVVMGAEDVQSDVLIIWDIE